MLFTYGCGCFGKVRRIKKLILKIKINLFENVSGEREVFSMCTWPRKNTVDFLGNAGSLEPTNTWQSHALTKSSQSHHLADCWFHKQIL